jgi:hypothetical protein
MYAHISYSLQNFALQLPNREKQKLLDNLLEHPVLLQQWDTVTFTEEGKI